MSDLISRQDALDILDEFEADIEVGKKDAYKTHREKLLSIHSAYHPLCALADRECPFQGKEFAWCLTCPHISEKDRELVKKAVAEPKTRCIAQIKIDRDDMEDLVNEKVNEIVDKMLEQKTDGVFVKGGLTIGGEPPMPEGCMDCKLQDRCLCIPPDLSADEISELYISRRPNCPLSMVAEPKTDDENELKFYYVESLDDYWVGRRLDNFYYATWHRRLGFIWSHSKYLPWGEHIVDENTLWKEHTYPSEPIEIPFTEWIVGFVKKYYARPKTGKWEIKTETDEYGLKRPKLVCSKCEKEPVAWDLTELFEFCPDCGAMMNGGEEE